jgi:hypothetical protein
MNKYVEEHDDEDERDDTLLSATSTIESLLIQALTNQLSAIVNSQGRAKAISYENAFRQAETLRSLAQTALMLSDSDSVYLHGAKIQDFLNRAILSHTFHTQSTSNESNP